MKFESLSPDSTLVKIAESGWRPTQGALNRSYGNCQGWTHHRNFPPAFPVDHRIWQEHTSLDWRVDHAAHRVLRRR